MTNPEPPGATPPAVAYAMLVGVMAMWASGVIAARAVHGIVPPIGFSFWRWVLVAVGV